MDPCRLSAIAYEAAQRTRSPSDPFAISKRAARDAFEFIDPQMVIESALSREWGNASENARWRLGRQTLLSAMNALPISGDLKAFAESVLYRKLNNALADRPGAVASMMQDLTPQVGTPSPGLIGPASEIGSAERWRQQLEQIILSQEHFTVLRLEMESEIDLLSSFTILGFHDMDSAFRRMHKEPPGIKALYGAGVRTLEVIRSISDLEIQGEPSERNNLDTVILADRLRLHELLGELPKDLSEEDALSWASDHKDDLRQIVALARAYCDAQRNALLNKLSRAYQKPDFCVRRDAVGPYADTLLPLSFSWDSEWYYGDETELQFQQLRPSWTSPAAKSAADEKAKV
jgi:hypothetical protein